MVFYAGLFLLIFAVSLDGFGVGVTYGMRRIHVPFIALLIIMLCSGGIVLTSMTIGHTLSAIIPPNLADKMGGIILIVIGIYCFYNVYQSKKINGSLEKKHPTPKDSESTSRNGIRINTVLKDPQSADLDSSGIISIKEALLLGFALALDAFGAGIGAALLGYSPFLTASLIGLMSGTFVYSGIKFGIVLSKTKWLQQMTFLPPVLLLILGILNIG